MASAGNVPAVGLAVGGRLATSIGASVMAGAISGLERGSGISAMWPAAMP